MFEKLCSEITIKNNSIELWKSFGGFDKKILIIAGFHGDEPQGIKILQEYLKENIDSKNEMFIIPCLNPDGYTCNSRVNSNGVDLNRNFPTKNWEKTVKDEFFGGEEPQSEIETKFLVNVLSEVSPDFILSIHAPFKIVNFDGPALDISEKIAKIFGYTVQGDIGYPTPGSFGTYCGVEKNIPTITLELGEDEQYIWQKEHAYKLFSFLANF